MRPRRTRRTRTEKPLERIERKIDQVLRRLYKMAVDQATFDAELADLVVSIEELTAAVDAFIAAQPAGVDLTAEAQTVADAKQKLVDELAKVTPPAP